jgi:hypothetical protein
VTTLIAGNANMAMVASMVGSAESGFGESLESGGLFRVSALERNLASVTMNIFSHLICFKNIFNKFSTLDVICKDNVAIKCITI